MRGGDVTGPYRGCEAIDHVVGDLDRLVDGPEGDGRQHRAEDLLARNRHGGRSEKHTSELPSQTNLLIRLLLQKKKNTTFTSLTNVTIYHHLALYPAKSALS